MVLRTAPAPAGAGSPEGFPPSIPPLRSQVRRICWRLWVLRTGPTPAAAGSPEGFPPSIPPLRAQVRRTCWRPLVLRTGRATAGAGSPEGFPPSISPLPARIRRRSRSPPAPEAPRPGRLLDGRDIQVSKKANLHRLTEPPLGPAAPRRHPLTARRRVCYAQEPRLSASPFPPRRRRDGGVCCRIAQLAERLTLDQEVLGSSPSPAATFSGSKRGFLGPMPVCEDAPCESSCESSKACSRDWDPGGCGHARGTRVSGRSRPRKGCGKRLRQGTCPGLCQSHRVTGKHPAPAPGQRATVGSLGTVREACSSPVQRRPTTAEGYPMTRGAGATIHTSGAKGNQTTGRACESILSGEGWAFASRRSGNHIALAWWNSLVAPGGFGSWRRLSNVGDAL